MISSVVDDVCLHPPSLTNVILQYFDYLHSLQLTFPVKHFIDFEYG